MITLTLILALFVLLNSRSKSMEFSKERCIPLRALLPLIIILGHISLFCGSKLSDFNQAGMFALGLFFFMSGYGLEHKRQRGHIVLKELATRLKKLLTPLVIPCLLYLGLLYVIDGTIFQTITANIKDYCIVLPFTWFVPILCFIYVIFYATSTFISNSWTFLIAVTAEIIVLSITNTAVSHIAYISLSNLAFPAGVLYKQNESRILNLMSRKSVTAIAIVIIITLTFCLTHLHNYFIPLEILIWTVVTICLYSRVQIKTNKVIVFLSKISYELYLCQGITFALIGQGPDNHNLLLHILLCLCMTIAIAYVCHTTTQKLTAFIFRK